MRWSPSSVMEGRQGTEMKSRDEDKTETYDKPSRQKRKVDKHKQKGDGGLIPKAAPYKRQRFSTRDVLDEDDE